MPRSRRHLSHTDAAIASPPLANVVSFPPCLNRKLVAKMVEGFLAIPPCPERAEIFRKGALARLERRRLALGLSPNLVRAEMLSIEHAVACRLQAMFSNQGGAA